MKSKACCANCFHCEVVDEEFLLCDIDNVDVRSSMWCDRYEYYPNDLTL